MLSPLRLLSLALLCLPLVAACGGDDDADFDAAVTIDAAVEYDAPPANCFDEDTHFRTVAYDNTFDTDPDLVAPLAMGSNDGSSDPDFNPTAPITGGATPPNDGFFDTTATFIGAIGDTDWTAGWTTWVVDEPDVDTSGLTEVVVNADITVDTTWSATNYYTLAAATKIFVDDGVTLTIQPGTIIRGNLGSALIVAPGGKLVAEGTVDDPIVFTSAKDTGAAAGDWAGVVLLGEAPINVSGGTDFVEGFDATEPRAEYGGTDAAHDCGSLRYVRIEFAGSEISADNELNELTIGGCGSATKIEYVQAHYGLDDGIEIFGGSPNLQHIVISAPDDDGLDWDQGFAGKVQFLIVKQVTGVGNYAFECDSNKNDNDATPRSGPDIWNATLIGNDEAAGTDRPGIHFRRGTAGKLTNSIMAHFSDFAINVDGWSSAEQAVADNLKVSHTYFYDINDGEEWPDGFDVDEGEEDDCEPAE